MKRRSTWILFFTALALAIAGLGRLSLDRKPGPMDAAGEQNHVTSRSAPLPARMRRFFDPPSLEQWIASGNISAEQSAHLRSLVDAGRFEEAVRYGLSLPDTSLARPTAVYYAWFAWGSRNRDGALASWENHPETQGTVALEGLMQGIAFSREPDPLLWLQEHRQSPAEGTLHQQLLTTVGVMWLISGEIEADPFVRMASRVTRPWYQTTELSAAISSLTEQCADLIAMGRLERNDGAEILLRLRSAVEQQAAAEGSDSSLEAGYADQLGSATGRVAGAADSMADYHLPAGEQSRRAFLVGLAGGLAEELPTRVAALAESDPTTGALLWRFYAGEPAMTGKTFNARFFDASLPENLLTAALDAGLDAGTQELNEDYAAKWIDGLPTGRVKNLAMLRLSDRLDQAGQGKSAENWKQKAAAAK